MSDWLSKEIEESGGKAIWFPQVFVGHFGFACCEVSHVLTLCPESYASGNLSYRNTEMHRDLQARCSGEYGVIPLVCRGTVSIFGKDLEKYGLRIAVGYFLGIALGGKVEVFHSYFTRCFI